MFRCLAAVGLLISLHTCVCVLTHRVCLYVCEYGPIPYQRICLYTCVCVHMCQFVRVWVRRARTQMRERLAREVMGVTQ